MHGAGRRWGSRPWVFSPPFALGLMRGPHIGAIAPRLLALYGQGNGLLARGGRSPFPLRHMTRTASRFSMRSLHGFRSHVMMRVGKGRGIARLEEERIKRRRRPDLGCARLSLGGSGPEGRRRTGRPHPRKERRTRRIRLPILCSGPLPSPGRSRWEAKPRRRRRGRSMCRVPNRRI